MSVPPRCVIIDRWLQWVDEYAWLVASRDFPGCPLVTVGMDKISFRKLWQALPSPFYTLLSGLVGLPVINQAAKTGYKIFARYRHLLPKRQEDCCHLPPRQKE
ncbi:MAG: hypothetical protein P8Y73_06405 [Desulfuromonadales bacterium]